MNVRTDKPFKLVYSLSLNTPVGHVIEPFAVQLNEKGAPTLSYQRIHQTNIQNFDNGLSEEDYELVRLMDEYSHETLARKFSKNKSRPVDFLKKEITDNYLKETIRPYIEVRLRKILKIIHQYKGLYLNGRSGNPTWKKLNIVREPASINFKFSRNEEGTQYYPEINSNNLNIKLASRHAHVIVFEPCWLLVNQDLYHFSQSLDGKKIKPFLNKPFLQIPPKSESEFYRKFIPQIIENYHVEAKGFDILKVKATPYPVLKLGRDLQSQPAFLLTFQYGEVSFFAEDPKGVHVYPKFNNNRYQFFKVVRSKNWEQEMIHILHDLGLESYSNKVFQPPVSYNNSHHDHHDFYTHYHNLINWLNQNKDTLLEAGFTIEQNFEETSFFLGIPQIQFEVQEHDNDWFDIHAMVYFGDEAVSFKNLKDHILTGKREYQLPSGQVAILPTEWFTDYLDFLKFSEDDDDATTFKLQKHHYNLLNSINGNQKKGIGKQYIRSLNNARPDKDPPPDLPANLNVQLRDYQRSGYEWLYFLRENQFGGCLADDMGLGKTLQTLTLLLKDKEESTGSNGVKPVPYQQDIFSNSIEGGRKNTGKNGSPTLIVMPSSLIHNWKAEILRFTPQLSCLQYTGNERLTLLQKFTQFDIIITTYGLVRNDIEYLKDFDFNYVILDESQIIKNPSSKTAKVVKGLKSQNRLVLTGTPIENTLTDLWSQMAFLNPGLLGGYQFFKREYVNPIEKKKDEDKREKLRTLIKPFLLRRTKEEVTKELPTLTEKTHFCEMGEAHEKEYERIKSYYRNQIMHNIEQYGFNKSQFMILQGLMQLRLAANHPSLVNEEFDEDSGKFNEIIDKVESVTSENHKVLIFSQFVKHLNYFENFFQKRGLGYSLLTGSTKNREQVIQEFRKDPQKQVFLISLKAGGVGLNLVEADYVLITDPWWNPATESQAINRAHRIGQDKSVISYKFITQGTIEEKILKLQEKKSALVQDIITANQNITNQLTQEDLELLLN